MKCSACELRDESIFCDLPSEYLSSLDRAKKEQILPAHRMLFQEGDQPKGLYCVYSGKVKVYKMDANGNQQIVRLAGPGDLVGYRSLLIDEPYLANAESLEETHLCYLAKQDFFHILGNHPRTAMNVIQLLAGNLGHAESQLIALSHKTVRERLAEFLLHFKEKYGIQTPRGIRLNISLTRLELAELIGTTRESATRLLSDFKKKRLIATQGREITLLDVPRLLEAANLAE